MKLYLKIAVAMLVSAGSVAQAATLSVGPRNPGARACYLSAKAQVTDADAMAACERALQIEPLSSRDMLATYVNRGIIHHFRGDHARAMRDYDAALAINPDQPEALLNKALAALVLDANAASTGSAITLIDRALAGAPEQPWVGYYLRGAANELAGNDSAAYGDYRHAATLKPDYAEANQALARFTLRPGT